MVGMSPKSLPLTAKQPACLSRKRKDVAFEKGVPSCGVIMRPESLLGAKERREGCGAKVEATINRVCLEYHVDCSSSGSRADFTLDQDFPFDPLARARFPRC